MSVIVKGHARLDGPMTLAIEGQSEDTYSSHNAEAMAIYGFLWDNLPSGTYDLLAVRLCLDALGKLSRLVCIDEYSDLNEVRAACEELVTSLDKEIE